MQELVDALRRWGRWEIAQLRHHREVLVPGEMNVELRLLRHVTHAALECDRIAPDRLAVEQDFAFGRLDQADDHLHRGGLTGTVRSEVAGDFSGAS